MSNRDKFWNTIRKRRGLLIIIAAALSVELISARQYYHMHSQLEMELEKRAESELTLKAILIKGTLNSAEDVLVNHLWDISENLSQPESASDAVERMVQYGRNLRGGFVCFVPDYYPSKEHLFEPYTRRLHRLNDSVVTSQIASSSHDYTQMAFYQQAIASNSPLWVEPYLDNEGAQDLITSYVMPIHDCANRLAGVVGVDVSLDWLSDTIDRRHIYPSSFLLLLSENDKPIIRPSESRVSKDMSEFVINLVCDSTVVRQRSRSGRSTVIHFDTEGRDGTIFCANMKGDPEWQIVVVCYDDEVYAPISGMRLRLSLLMLAVFGLLAFIIILFRRNDEKLNEKMMEEERMGNELRIASNIQQTLLPAKGQTMVDYGDVSVAGRLIPAKAVGGDLYDAFVRDGKLFFCIGDVSGKGVPSALFMAITQVLCRNIASRESNPAHIVEQLNEAICHNNTSNFFVTLFLGVLDLPSGHLRYCNAGHEIPILIGKGEDSPLQCRLLDVKPNLPVGLFEDFKYEMQQMVMGKGETLFLYTDGLTEARNAQHELFGREHVIQMIADMGTTDPRQMVETTIDRVNVFAESTEQSDDLTLLAVRYNPSEDNNNLEESLTLTNDLKEVDKLGSFMKQVSERLNLPKSLAFNLRLAVEEAVVNVMEYAYPSEAKGNVVIHISSNGHRLKFVIIDSGVSFDPTVAAAADTTLSAEERPVGGLGILLVRELMDMVNYERVDGKNVLTLMKNYSEQDASDK